MQRLRDDIEKKDKEMKRMGDRIESLEDKIISVATENKKEAEVRQSRRKASPYHRQKKRWLIQLQFRRICRLWQTGFRSIIRFR